MFFILNNINVVKSKRFLIVELGLSGPDNIYIYIYVTDIPRRAIYRADVGYTAPTAQNKAYVCVIHIFDTFTIRVLSK